jgi:carboxyl-terminal processing protease
MLNDEEYAKFVNESDPTVLKAVNILKNNEAWPKVPQNVESTQPVKKTNGK